MIPISRNGRPAAACSRMRRAISSASRSTPGARTSAMAGVAPGPPPARPRETHGMEPRADPLRGIAIAQGQGEVRMMAQRADDAKFGIGQRMKPIHPDGAYAAQPLAFDALRRPLEQI